LPRFEPHKFSGQNWKHLRVGLLGGSFNPLHDGHIHIARESLKRLHLDAVWFLVSPQNPLKESSGNFDERFAKVKIALTPYPKFIPVRLEEVFITRRSFHTLKKMKLFFSGTKFVWLAGDDISQEFDRWFQWQQLPDLAPFYFFERKNTVRRSKVFTRFSDQEKAFRLRNMPRNPLSSSDLRATAKQGIIKLSHEKER
jgi:nicotinate-nucleotide adenylyltransferase